jgi:hypothetical protein
MGSIGVDVGQFDFRPITKSHLTRSLISVISTKCFVMIMVYSVVEVLLRYTVYVPTGQLTATLGYSFICFGVRAICVCLSIESCL